MTVEKQLIDKVESIRTTLNEISVYNLDVKTSLELYYELAKKVNEVITEISRFEGVVSEEVVKQNEKLIYLLGEGLKEQVALKIDELIINGTIQDLINNKIFNDLNNKLGTKVDKMRSKVLFMPVNPTTENAPGDCSVIVTKTGKVIMIDTGASDSYYLIYDNLKKQDISKIDYIIITHYHADHCQNLESLKRDFNLTETIYYLQKHTSKFTYSDNYVLTLVGNNTKIYPNNNDKLSVDDIDLTFFNCSQSDIDYYDTNSNNYNDYSMCCYLESYNNKILFASDINLKAQGRLIEQGYFKKVDLLKVEHHAYDSTVNNDYIRKVNPKYAVVSEGERALSTKITVISETLSLLNGLGCEIAWCGKEPVVYYFNEFGNEFVHNYSVGGCFKDVGNYTIIYVDDTYTGLSDGTYANPYRTIREALSELSKINSLNIQIVPKKGSFTSDEHIRVANLNGTLKLDNITVRGFDIRNSNVILGNFTVTGTHSRAMIIESSIVEFNNLTLNGDCRSASTEYEGRGIAIYKSKFNGETLNISNKRIGVCAYNNSDVYIKSLEGLNNEYALLSVGGSNLLTSTCTMTYITNIKDTDKISLIDGAIKNDLTSYLSEGNDLNNYKTVNTRYVSKTGGITSSILNKPDGLGYSFVLEVKKQTEDGSIMQVIKSRHLNSVNSASNKTGIFIRTYNTTDGWSNWFEITLK